MNSDWEPNTIADHPRLLATESDFDSAQRLINQDDRTAAWFQRVEDHAVDLLETPPNEYEIPDGLRLLQTSRSVLRRVFDLGLCYRLTGDEVYAERLWVELRAVADFPDWNPDHFLDTAELTAGFGIAYDWLYDYWSGEQQRTIREAILEKGIEPAMPGYRAAPGDRPGYCFWIDSPENWNTICNGGLTIGALALLDEGHDDVATTVIKAAKTSIDRAIATIGSNGGWPEGIMYWAYNTKYLVWYLSALQSALETTFGFKERPGVRELGQVPIHLTAPTNTVFAFGDATEARPIREPALFWLAREFDRPEYATYQLQSLGADGPVEPGRDFALNVLWRAPSLDVTPAQTDHSLSQYFPEGDESMTGRSECDDPRAAFVGFKAGANSVGHADLDIGTFVYEVDGVRWARDLGTCDYNLPGYFDSGPDGRRWTYYRKRAEGHNTLAVDPDDGPDQRVDASCEIHRIEQNSDAVYGIADLSDAYGVSVERGVGLFYGRSELEIRDEIVADGADVWWFMHTEAEVDLEGRTAFLQLDGEDVTAALAEPTGATFEVMDATPLPASPHPNGEASVEGVRKLAVHCSDVTQTAIDVRVGPEATLDREPMALSSW